MKTIKGREIFGYVVWDTQENIPPPVWVSSGGAKNGYNQWARRWSSWTYNREGECIRPPKFEEQDRYVIRPLVLGDEE